MSSVKIGIIGGTGLNKPDLFTPERPDEEVVTPFGDPSDKLQHGTIAGVPCVLLPRHGRDHTIHPSRVNYRANLWALKEAGCTHILAATACGSLREHIKPGDFVTVDSFIDRTYKRETTFHDGTGDGLPGILHLPMNEPFCPHTRLLLQQACEAAGVTCHKQGVTVTVEGPRFSTVAESNMFRLLGGDVVNMTTVPEVILARELGLCYAALAMATDYDCWRESTEPVSVEVVMQTMRENAEKAVAVMKTAVELISEHDWTEIIPNLKKSVAMNLMLPK